MDLTGGQVSLARSKTLLSGIADIDETDPMAPVQLRSIADGFRDLVTQQRAANAPRSAARAAYYVLSAFNAYAAALDGAATGIERHDQTVIDKALDGLDQANSAVSRANAEIEKTANVCNLEVGGATPSASRLTRRDVVV